MSDNNKLSGDHTSFLDTILSKHTKEIANRRDKQLENAVREGLATLGFEFDDRQSLLGFCSRRVQQISFEDEPYRKEIRLDYKSIDEPGLLLVWFSTEMKITHSENGDVKITMG